MHVKRSEAVAVLFGALALGIGIGAVADNLLHVSNIPRDVREFNSQYHFINPLLACGDDLNSLTGDEAKHLQRDMETSIREHRDAGDVTEVAVYYRDLTGGPWVGIDFDKAFTPGSLLKVPLAMSVYKRAEQDASLLTQKLPYTGEEVDASQFFEVPTLKPGEYSVSTLMERMLLYSDNNATNEIANLIGAEDFQATYLHLGVPRPPVEGASYTISTREYASFFRVLYNATYLDHVGSEEVLKLLSKTEFKAGIVAGVPSDVVVAHKFGERSFEDSNIVQLHDCGIVYVPNHPYLFCVMTRGTDFTNLAEVIADLSHLAYNYAK
jgi:beta-lactamase class A